MFEYISFLPSMLKSLWPQPIPCKVHLYHTHPVQPHHSLNFLFQLLPSHSTISISCLCLIFNLNISQITSLPLRSQLMFFFTILCSILDNYAPLITKIIFHPNLIHERLHIWYISESLRSKFNKFRTNLTLSSIFLYSSSCNKQIPQTYHHCQIFLKLKSHSNLSQILASFGKWWTLSITPWHLLCPHFYLTSLSQHFATFWSDSLQTSPNTSYFFFYFYQKNINWSAAST